jgi:hypothetical protein
MRKAIMAGMAAASLLALSACNKQPAANGNEANATEATSNSTAAATDINGTWKADIDSVQFDQKPDEMLLQNGTFSCKSCTPAYSVPADGAFHPVSLPYADSDSVKLVDPHTVTETAKKGGKQVSVTTMTVSADGNTLNGKFTDSSTPGTPGTGEFSETRVGAAPAGAHAISGQWKPTKLSNFNDAALTFTINVNGNTYHSSSPDGTSFDATIGGGDVPIKGDIAGTTAAVSKGGDNAYKVTRKRGGKVVGETTFTLGADGKLNAESHNVLSGSTLKWTATKQS